MMRKLFLFPLIVTFLLAGCSTTTTTIYTTSTPSIMATTSQDIIQPSQTFEYDIDYETTEQTYVLQLTAGDRVEGEVNAIILTSPGYEEPDMLPIFVEIKDPYGNIVAQSSMKYTLIDSKLVHGSNQSYPWGFAFLAAANGEYTFEVRKPLESTRYGVDIFGGKMIIGKATFQAHLKIVYFPRGS